MKTFEKTTHLYFSMEIDTIKDRPDDNVRQGKNQYQYEKNIIFMCDFITLIRRLKNRNVTFFSINFKCKKYQNCHNNFVILNQIYCGNIRILIVIFI